MQGDAHMELKDASLRDKRETNRNEDASENLIELQVDELAKVAGGSIMKVVDCANQHDV
jgi:hypothetical protein